MLSLGIIGGADGPTAILITGGFPWSLLLLSGIGILGIILYKRKHK